jgi:tRNA G46 methylase TrmB
MAACFSFHVLILSLTLPPGYVIDRSLPHTQTGPLAQKHALHLLSYLEHAPVPGHTRTAFALTAEWLADRGGLDQGARPLIIDSGCGTGRSTILMAQQHPGYLVVGIDRSCKRLAKGLGSAAAALPSDEEPLVSDVGSNALLVRADLAGFWRLAVEAGWRARRHRILFPNPYPKPAHLSRRWHTHPSFPLVMRLGGELELRSNWRVYLDETLIAVQAIAELGTEGRGAGEPAALTEVLAARRALDAQPCVAQYSPSAPFASEFEEKYAAAKLPLYRLSLSLS